MKFWRNNQIDQEYDMSPQAVATAFAASMVTAMALEAEFGPNTWSSKLAVWKPERVLRDWLTDPELLFNAVWIDEDEFQVILSEALDQLRAWDEWRKEHSAPARDS